jgi:hypothetical protein
LTFEDLAPVLPLHYGLVAQLGQRGLLQAGLGGREDQLGDAGFAIVLAGHAEVGQQCREMQRVADHEFARALRDRECSGFS